VQVGAYYLNDFLAHAERDKLDETYNAFLSTHLSRSASVLLCLLTEIQGHCRFDGANINERMCRVWSVLMPFRATKELYDGRYSKLMKERGIEKVA
jgi:hypothetical protein